MGESGASCKVCSVVGGSRRNSSSCSAQMGCRHWSVGACVLIGGVLMCVAGGGWSQQAGVGAFGEEKQCVEIRVAWHGCYQNGGLRFVCSPPSLLTRTVAFPWSVHDARDT